MTSTESYLPRVVGDKRPWCSRTQGDWTIWWAGRSQPSEHIMEAARARGVIPGGEELEELLSGTNTPFAAMVAGPSCVFAAVDQNRSYPVFYSTDRTRNVVSGDARAAAGAPVFKPVHALEAAMSGYVTGQDTLLEGLSQLPAGSFLTWAKGDGAPAVRQYFRYTPLPPETGDEASLIEALRGATEQAIGRLVDDAAGRPIWVSLSGGLDSRLIAAKLKELGCPRVQTFSYGLPGNTEARLARNVARRLGLPWLFVPCRRREMRSLMDSDARREYWDFADGLASVPNPQDFAVMLKLVREGRIADDAVLVNGQSGDFTSGGHLRHGVLKAGLSFAEIADHIIDKHFDLWRSLKTPETRQELRRRIAASVGFRGSMQEPLPPGEGVAIAELWEHQERQAKYVINQQRAYEFFDIDWRLPLWDMDLVNFWRAVPTGFKVGQCLYKMYLRQWDFSGLFTELPENVSAWGPGTAWWAVPASSLLHKLTPQRLHRAIQKPLSYFGRFGHHYAVFGLKEVMASAADSRNPVSLYARHWLEELGLSDEKILGDFMDPAAAPVDP